MWRVKTTYSTCFLLYHLARNEEAQGKVFAEALEIMPDFERDEITAEKLNSKISYSKAVLKETFRLNPVSVGVGRITNTDLVLSNYQVPKGVIIDGVALEISLYANATFVRFQTIAVTQNFITCRLDKHFASPEKFIPERWLKTTGGTSAAINPYLVLPFSHGMRSCIARRFAEQNILVLMLRVRD